MAGSEPGLASKFTAAMDVLGPFEPRPRLAIAVSGGADSLALAILARDWARGRGGSTLALVVDHGLRAASANEVRVTVERLSGVGIPASILPLRTLRHGSALAERARIMRYAALAEACRDGEILHLLLGHHAADQVETLAMRVLRGSGTHGLAGMSAVREMRNVRLLRPLLGMDPAALRRLLTERGIGWVEDPSNRDTSALRPRLRQHLSAQGPNDSELAAAMAKVGRLRCREELDAAAELAGQATLRPEGFALLSGERIGSAALSALVQAVGGMPYPASPGRIGVLAGRLTAATVAGVRLMPAGRLADGWLLVREERAVSGPIEARPGALWDNRFRVVSRHGFPAGTMIGKLGSDAVRFRADSDLPSAVLRTLPALRIGKVLAAIPHLGYVWPENDMRGTLLFSPNKPVSGACFVPA